MYGTTDYNQQEEILESLKRIESTLGNIKDIMHKWASAFPPPELYKQCVKDEVQEWLDRER